MDENAINFKDWTALKIIYLSGFVKYWQNENKKDEENFPSDLSPQEWEEQLEWYISMQVKEDCK